MIIIFKGVEYDTERDYEAEQKKMEEKNRKISFSGSWFIPSSSYYNFPISGSINTYGNAVGNIRAGRSWMMQ